LCFFTKIKNSIGDRDISLAMILVGIISYKEIDPLGEFLKQEDVTQENYNLGIALCNNAISRFNKIAEKEHYEIKKELVKYEKKFKIRIFYETWQVLFLFSYLAFNLSLFFSNLEEIGFFFYILMTIIFSFSFFYLIERIIFKNKNLEK
jgi:hypothetical protein